MGNYFDQFDAAAAPAPNPFDKFDPPKPPGMGMPSVDRALNLGLTGANDVILGIPDKLTNVMTSAQAGLAKLLPQIPGVTRAPEEIDALVERGRQDAGQFRDALPRTEPQTPGERIIYRAGAEVPTALAVAAGLPPVLRAGGGTVAPAIGNALTVKTGGQLATQAAAGVGAGAGAGAAAEAFPHNPMAETVGGLAGGGLVVGGLEAGRYGWNALKALLSPFYAQGREAIVANTMQRNATDPRRIGLPPEQSLPDLPSGQPAPGATTAEASRDPGLMQLERSLRSGDPSLAGDFTLRDAARNSARREALAGVAPDGGPQGVRDFFQAQLRQVQGLGDDVIQAATGRVQQRLDALGPGATPMQAGNILREEYNAALQAAKGQTRSAFSAVDPDNATAVPIINAKTNAGQAFERIYAREGGGATMGRGGAPADLTALADEVAAAGAETANAIPIAHVQNLRARANDLAQQYARTGDSRAASVAGSIRDSLGGAVDEAVANNALSPEVAAAWRTARSARAEQGSRFEQGASRSVGATRGYSEPILTPAEVPAAYFNSSRGGADDAAKFVEALGNRPRAVQALQDHAVNDIRQYATNPDGTINPDRWRAWMSRHEGALSQFPELQASLRSVRSAQEALDAAGETVRRGVEEVEGSAARFFLRNDPDQAIAAALSGRSRGQNVAELVRLANADESGAALGGLRRSIVDEVMRRSQTTATTATGEQVISPAQFQRWWSANREAVAPAFSEPQLQVFDRIAADLASRARVDAVGRAAGSNTAQNLASGYLLDTLLPGNFSQTALPQSAGKVLGWVYKLAPDDTMRLLYDAMLNPGTAQAMMARPTPFNARRLNQALTEAAARIGVTAEATAQTSDR